MERGARRRPHGRAAAEAELEQALAEELEYLPKKEHRRKQTEFTERARRAARRAETAALDHALQLAGLWYRDLACLAADAEELVLATDRLEELRSDIATYPCQGLQEALELVEDTRMRLPFNVSYDLALQALAYRLERTLGGPAGHGMTEVRIRGAYATVRGEGIEDEVAVEEPLEIRVDGAPIAVTMRTPGEDEELALGFLHGEGLIDGPRAAGPPADLAANTIEVAGPLLREPGNRSFYATSSCGVCGKGALEEVAVHAPPVADGPRIARDLLAALPDRLRQPTFARTGGLHATGLFSAAGELLYVREDVGRHNAMDKVIGRALLDGLVPLSELVLCVSGRLSFELVQKAAVAGAPILVGVGAPSSLAVRLADDRNLTLAGFARGGRVNVYTASAQAGIEEGVRSARRTSVVQGGTS